MYSFLQLLCHFLASPFIISLLIIKDCEWFSRNQDNGNCFAFSDCPSLDEPMHNTISGQRDCSVYTSNLTIFLSYDGYSEFRLFDIKNDIALDYVDSPYPASKSNF